MTSAVANAASADSVPWSGVTGKPASFPPTGHTHAGSEITSPVPNASAVPWSGVTGKPASFPPASHQHAGGDVTSPVASAASADAAPWNGVTGKPTTFPPSGHTHSGADILDATLPGTKLQDDTVAFQKLKVDQNVFTDLSTTAQPINGGAAFSPGVHAFRMGLVNGSFCAGVLSVGRRNASYEFLISGLTSATLNMYQIPGVLTLEFTNMFDGRTYQLVFDTTAATATLRITSGVATGQTTFSLRRMV